MSRRVLIADDEPLTAEMLALMLTVRGYDVICAHDGREALRQAHQQHPDVILMDVLMPGMDGDEVTRTLRAEWEECPPVVLFSSEDETDVDWQEAGADVFLQKPIDLMKLPDLLDSLLDEPPPTGEGRSVRVA